MTNFDIIAVDGGGSSSTFLACAFDGAVVARATVGPTSPKAVGERAAASELARGFDLLRRSGADVSGARVAVCGLSGFDSPASARAMGRMLDACGVSADRRLIVSDALLPLFACGFREGAVMIAGTGSIAVSLDAQGVLRRVGGWGYEWSDEGSGHWIGARALSRALAFRDGRCAYDPLFDDVLCIVGAASFDDLAIWAIDAPDAASVARIAPAVLDGRTPAAVEISDQAAARLVDLYLGLQNGAVRADDAVVFAGGVLLHDAVRCVVEDGIARQCAIAPRVVALDRDPVEGGIEMGRLHLEGKLPSIRNPWE